MTNKMRLAPLALGLSLFFAACQNETKTEETTTATDTTATTDTLNQQPIALADFPPSPEFPDARLSFGAVNTEVQGDSVKVTFNFNVKNFELKSQTADAQSRQCNNSAQGQHIHFILNNKPYVALYEPKHQVTLPKNSEHYLLAFLSRSYHESLKNKGAAVLMRFKIDENGKLQKLDVPKSPMLFYSRPKGDYIGKDTENILLDFYVWNDSLSQDGYKVKAHVAGDGKQQDFTLNQWKPYVLNNIPMGKPSVTLTLLDKDGNKVDGPNTEITREFNMAKDEPMKP